MLLVLVASTIPGQATPLWDQYYYSDGVDMSGVERDFRRRRLSGDVCRFAISWQTYVKPVEHYQQNILECAILHSRKIKGEDMHIYEVYASVCDLRADPTPRVSHSWSMTIGDRTFTSRPVAAKTASEYRAMSPLVEDCSKWRKPERLSRAQSAAVPTTGLVETRVALAQAWECYHRDEETARTFPTSSSSPDIHFECAANKNVVYQ